MPNPDGSHSGSSWTDALKHALFEDEPPNPGQQPDANPAVSTNQKPTVQSKSPEVVTPVPQAVSAPLDPHDVTPEDRQKMVEAISAKVFASGTLYGAYRTTYDDMADAGLAEEQHKRAAWTLVIKRNGLSRVMESMAECQRLLAEEKGAFETSLKPTQDGGIIGASKKAIEQVAQDKAEKNATIERMNREIEALDAKKAELEAKIAEEEAKQRRARTVFDVAHGDIGRAIEADMQFVASQFQQPAQ